MMTLARDTQAETLTASRIVNTWNEEHIETIIRAYGEEQFSRKIAQAIIAARTFGPITTTTMLAEIITSAVPGWYRHRRLHPATKTFQALRITVNDEIEALEEALGKAIAHLNPNGRIAIISFHSLEDRLVKRRFREWQKEGQGMVITKRPITPSPDEVKKNPRARSAKLRVFEKNK
jgi:16S rRNA (cytosine1402-N4)-methyltransferase